MKHSISHPLAAAFAALGAIIVWNATAFAHPGHDGADPDTAPAFLLAQAERPPGGAPRSNRAPQQTGTSGTARNEVSIAVEGEYRVIKANGWPDHAPGAFPRRGNPNTPTAQSYGFRVPLKPKAEAEPVRRGGWWWGVALNGVPFEPGTAESWNNDMRSAWRYEAATVLSRLAAAARRTMGASSLMWLHPGRMSFPRVRG